MVAHGGILSITSSKNGSKFDMMEDRRRCSCFMGHPPLISTRQFSLPTHVSLFPQKFSRILQGGFKIGGMGGYPISHGAAMGYGIYLGAAAATSLGYATGGNRIDFAKILPAVVRFDILPPYSLSTGVSSHMVVLPIHQFTNPLPPFTSDRRTMSVMTVVARAYFKLYIGTRR